MIAPLVQSYLFVKGKQFAVDSSAQESVLREFLQFFLKLSLSASNNGCEDHDALAFRQAENVLNNLFHALSRDCRAAGGTMRNSYRGKKQPHVVVYFCDCSDRGPRTTRYCFLFNRDR